MELRAGTRRGGLSVVVTTGLGSSDPTSSPAECEASLTAQCCRRSGLSSAHRANPARTRRAVGCGHKPLLRAVISLQPVPVTQARLGSPGGQAVRAERSQVPESASRPANAPGVSLGGGRRGNSDLAAGKLRRGWRGGGRQTYVSSGNYRVRGFKNVPRCVLHQQWVERRGKNEKQLESVPREIPGGAGSRCRLWVSAGTGGRTTHRPRSRALGGTMGSRQGLPQEAFLRRPEACVASLLGALHMTREAHSPIR